MRYLNLILLPLICPILASAQKLPSVQKESLRAPANIKIDGKTTEWNDKFQAYNNGPELYYTISNDDDNLYLAIKATNKLVVRKIIAGSITLSISPAQDKNKKMAITYPVFYRNNWPNIDLKDMPQVTKTSVADSVDVTIFIDKINKGFADKSKEIALEGVAGLDKSVSIYNENQIKASGRFDDFAAFTYELAFPLKYLGLSAKDANSFDYNIKLNGSDKPEGATLVIHPGGGYELNAPKPIAMADVRYMQTPTDLSGTYTLAKK